MPHLALNICFANPQQALVQFAQEASETITFELTVTSKDLEELRWYIEVYATQYTGEPDDEEAKRIEAMLTAIGGALFKTLFPSSTALAIFQRFQQQATDKLLTIHTNDAQILALPWELLHQPQLGFLSQQQPPVAIRRFCIKNQVPGFTVQAKPILRLLFIVSRPSDEGFLNPRLDPQAVLDALVDHKIAQIEVEFLRPATLARLQERLQNKDLPTIDIIHFDGHGSYDETTQCGYLAFEKSRVRGNAIAEKTHAISATQLAELFIPHHIALVVLSACQSAAVGNEPLGSVAAGLTDKGVPSVLAMVYSVLTTTTRQLFSAFYQQLATGQGIGTALDSARQAMAQHNKRGKRRRGEGEFELSLQDWFVPALYQSGHDTALLTQPDLAGVKNLQGLKHHDLPALQTAGFFGRSWELWVIERGYVLGVERITITGFGGQGKTYCAIEAAQWLLRTDLFDAVCFVDFSRYQGLDALRYAMNALGALLDTTLPDETAVPPLLQTRRLLWVWDNLESLAAETLDELLAVAVHWSEHCRFLFTTRQHRFTQADYAESSPKHRYLDLGGLAEIDALAYFNQLWQIAPQPEQPYPARYELLALFSKVAFHPLSIGLLAQQLKTRTIAELGERLEALLLCEPEGSEDKSLLASLKLSLERLPPEQRELVKRLGVFQGGAFKDDLLTITEISSREWIILRPVLENSGLIQPEDLTNLGVKFPYLKFHPALAFLLWCELTITQQETLLIRYRHCYYQLARLLYDNDSYSPHTTRSIALRELPDLLHGVYVALRAIEYFALDFAKCVNRVLAIFGLHRDIAKLNHAIQQASGDIGSHNWYLAQSNQGEQLFSKGDFQNAETVFHGILKFLDKSPSDKFCTTLGCLGRCFVEQGKTQEAIVCYKQSLDMAQQLEPSDHLQRQLSVFHSDLAMACTDIGDYFKAKSHCEQSLNLANGDIRQIVVVHGQLSRLASLQGDLSEAKQSTQSDIRMFQSLNEPKSEASAWNQLGGVYQRADMLSKAEDAFRKAVRIYELHNDLAGAAVIWNQLGFVTQAQGKFDAAESWFCKAIKYQRGGNPKFLANSLNNLANLLQNYPVRLNEAQQLAEEALEIRKDLDEASAEIWMAYGQLADIFERQLQNQQAKEFRQLSRDSYFRFAGMPLQIKQSLELISFVLRALEDDKERADLEILLLEFTEQWQQYLVIAIQRILNGERQSEVLLGPLKYKEAAIVHLILKGIENPESLEALFNA